MEPDKQQQLKQPLLQDEDPDEAIIRQRNEEMRRLGTCKHLISIYNSSTKRARTINGSHNFK